MFEILFNIDFEAMLYPDTNCISIFKKVNPNFVNDNNIDFELKSYAFSSNKVSAIEITENMINIKELFDDKKTFDQIISRTGQMINYNCIDPKIYLKDNVRAIFTVDDGNSNSTTYRVTLNNQKLKFEFLSSIMS